ncbi:TonB-dependent Receptor Plug Domain [Granulicella pectinivorans]|uniref:TonB-dependent Receptor Plug Domain n=2 Tax=Granulicella pectinivorans TaxID=474950 RepID=A0A1I6MDK2_9BACT|nr:TonB-dependent Receptor Plug Domain [Granulicella pectinivorans]
MKLVPSSKQLERLLRTAQTISLVCMMILSFGASRALAQADQGAITGLIQDATGAVVPNADVTLKSIDTGLVVHTRSDDSGNYVFSPIKIGNYSVTASATGFSSTVQENIQLHVQDRVAVNLQLKPGTENQTVTVTAAPPLLQSQEGSTGQVIESQTINQTPLNGRNWVFIAQLTAGVAPANGARGQKGGDFNANGQRAEQNNYIMDGVDNNVNVVDFFNGASYVVRPPPDALAEFKVQTGSYSSEFGHSAGAVVNASIKSGTNQIHGSLWEYVRNDAFDVREYFQGTSPIAKYRQNQFGATLGFPIIKDKLFFFGDVEANRIVFGETHSGLTVPTVKQRTGDFSELLSANTALNANVVKLYLPNLAANGTTPIANNRLDQSGVTLDPVALKLLSLFPLPNIGGVGKTFSNFTSQTDTLDNTFQWDVRADYNMSSKDQMFGRFSYNHEPSTHPAPLGPILDGGGFGDTGQLVSLGENFAGSETHIFTPSLTNEFRFGYNYGHYAGLHENANNSTLASSLGLGGVPFAQNNGGLPYFSVSGLSSFGSPQFYATNEYENVYQILDNVTKVVGNHTLKGGVTIQRIRFSTSQPTQPRGTYNYTGVYTGQTGTANTGFGVADFLTNNMNSAAISNVFTSDDVRFNRAFYVQDDWKASQRLTLNYGIRYDYSTPYLERHDNQAAFVPTSGFTASSSTGLYLIPKSKQNVVIPAKFLQLLTEDHITLTYTDNRYLVNPQKTNVAPRVGFAFKATDKAVIHGGYGIFFGGLESTGYYPNFGENFPFEFDSSYSATGSCVAGGACPTNGYTLESGLPQKITAPSQPTLRGGEGNVRTPYSEQFNLTVEYGISNSMVASIGYVGAVARHLQFFPNPNGQTALTPSGFSGYTDANGDKTNPFQPFPHFNGFSYTAYDAASNYNSLQAKLEKRMTHGFSFLTTYTYGKSMDNANTPLGSSNDQGTRSVNILGLGADYGPSGFDVKQRFTINGNYQLPFGKGQKYLSQGGILDYLVGGWSDSFVFRAQTGQPLTIGTNGITNPGGAAYNAILVGDPFAPGGTPNSSNPGITCATTTRTPTNWYNPCAFANPKADNIGYSTARYPDGSFIPNSVSGQAAYAYVGSNRGQTRGPGYERIDTSLFKSFHTFREQALQFRADVFNLLNTPAYGDPSTRNISSTGGNITNARTFQSNTPDSRFFQFALKYTF